MLVFFRLIGVSRCLNPNFHFNLTGFFESEPYWKFIAFFKRFFQTHQHQVITVGIAFGNGNLTTYRNINTSQRTHFHDVTVHFHLMDFNSICHLGCRRQQLIQNIARVFNALYVNNPIFAPCH